MAKKQTSQDEGTTNPADLDLPGPKAGAATKSGGGKVAPIPTGEKKVTTKVTTQEVETQIIPKPPANLEPVGHTSTPPERPAQLNPQLVLKQQETEKQLAQAQRELAELKAKTTAPAVTETTTTVKTEKETKVSKTPVSEFGKKDQNTLNIMIVIGVLALVVIGGAMVYILTH